MKMSEASSLVYLSCALLVSDFVPCGENEAWSKEHHPIYLVVSTVLKTVGKITARFYDRAHLSQMLRRHLSHSTLMPCYSPVGGDLARVLIFICLGFVSTGNNYQTPLSEDMPSALQCSVIQYVVPTSEQERPGVNHFHLL